MEKIWNIIWKIKKLIHNLSYYDEMLEKYNAKMIKGNIYLLYL